MVGDGMVVVVILDVGLDGYIVVMINFWMMVSYVFIIEEVVKLKRLN